VHKRISEPKQGEVSEEFRILNNEEFLYLYWRLTFLVQWNIWGYEMAGFDITGTETSCFVTLLLVV